MLQPANAATPAETATVAFVHDKTAKAGLEGCVIVNVTLPVLVVATVLPPRSCTATTGWVPKATLLLAPLGDVVKLNCAAPPTETVRLALFAGVNALSAACNRYTPARSILHPAKVATPPVTNKVVFAHVRSAPAGVVIVIVTALVSLATVIPDPSCTVTVGWVAKATPPVELLGCVVNTNFAAVPNVTVKRELIARVNALARAVNE